MNETVLKNLVLLAKLPGSHQFQQHHKKVELIMSHTLARRAALMLGVEARMGHLGHLLGPHMLTMLTTRARTSSSISSTVILAYMMIFLTDLIILHLGVS